MGRSSLSVSSTKTVSYSLKGLKRKIKVATGVLGKTPLAQPGIMSIFQCMVSNKVGCYLVAHYGLQLWARMWQGTANILHYFPLNRKWLWSTPTADNFFPLKGHASLFWSGKTKMCSQVRKHNWKNKKYKWTFCYLKNRQSITARSLLRLLLLRMSYLTTLGPKMWLINISVKYSEQNSVSGEVSKIGKHRIKIGRVRWGLGLYCYTHSVTQKESIVPYA